MSVQKIIGKIVTLLVVLLLLGGSVVPPGDNRDFVRRYTRSIEFNFVSWTVNAIWTKLNQAALGVPRYLNEVDQQKFVKNYLAQVSELQSLKDKIEELYATPNLKNRELYTRPLIHEQLVRQKRLDIQGPLAEAMLQTQISAALAKDGITLGGQPIPPILYHVTPLPYALVVSPRDVIRHDVQISLLPDLTLDQIIQLEKNVEESKNLSALVVPVGGIGIYPTMVMSTSSISWLTEVIGHEWTHNYLTLHPLGIRYFSSNQLITMNETTASIAGTEISRTVLETYYPDDVPPEPLPEWPLPVPYEELFPGPDPEARLVFNYNREMNRTRVEADRLLAEGKIEEAENYMEQRRLVFVNNGYNIRRINHAYFAFYGSYAEASGGAQGKDPVGPAVYELRAQSPSLAAFLKRIAWISSFQSLEQLLSTGSP